jgi:diguanylate cyclase (GGDEF)-like protein
MPVQKNKNIAGPGSGILVVESEIGFAAHMLNNLAENGPARMDMADNPKAAYRLLEGGGDEYFLVISDPAAQVALEDLIQSHELSLIIVGAGPAADGINGQAGVLDYIDWNIPASAQYLERLVRRLCTNLNTLALVVDDSATCRQIVEGFLESHLFQVLMAEDGEQALQLMEDHPDIRLAVIDHEMSGMNGFTLATNLRSDHEHEELAIIGLSGSGMPGLGVSFIKFGADDFIAKPFQPDEFLVRVNDTMNKQALLRELRDLAHSDSLTGLSNRRHFFDKAAALYANAQRGNLTLALAMIDLDHFKQVNDIHGHDAGDEVLRRISGLIRERARDGYLVARLGGEEFCILAVNPDMNQVDTLFDEIRLLIAGTKIDVGSGEIAVTVSMGICTELGETLEEMLKKADEVLYEAKESGRNRIRRAGSGHTGDNRRAIKGGG